MTTIAHLGMTRLVPGLKAEGAGIIEIGNNVLQELGRPLAWDDVLDRCGRQPDVLLYSDVSGPPPLVGLADFPCPTVFYGVDSHIHSWFPIFAQGFDLCAMSLKDHLEPCRGQRLTEEQLLWLPAYPQPDVKPRDVEPEYDLLFVGKVDKDLTPGRYAFLNELKALFPSLTLARGDFRELFPKAKVVLNVAEHGDMNFRVFEAMACGSCLLTPAIGHGQEELFTDGKHLRIYRPMDAKHAASIAAELVIDDAKRNAIAQAGLAEIRAKHTVQHRARTLLDRLNSLDLERLVAERRANAKAINTKHLKLLYLHWAESLADIPAIRQAYLKAAA